MTHLRRYVAGALFGALAVLFFFAAAAHAQSACAPADQIISELESPKYGEALVFSAAVRTPQGLIPIRFFANAQTGTWTMLTLPSAGVACIAGTGSSFEPPKPKGNPVKWNTR